MSHNNNQIHDESLDEQQPLPIGHKLYHGGYEITAVLGKGSSSIVYLAVDNSGSKVAIKEYIPLGQSIRIGVYVSPSNDFQEDFNSNLDRFKNEYQTLTKLKHPNIVKAHLSFDENQTHYFVMDYCKQLTLEKYLAKKGKLTISEMKALLREIAPAI